MFIDIPKSKPGVQPIKGIGTLVREGLIRLVKIDREVFVKTDREKKEISKIKSNHKNMIKRAGLNPLRVLNV